MPFILAVDYDGTLFTGSYPEKGPPNQKIIDKVKKFIECGAEVVLWTCRDKEVLKEAVERCKEAGLEFVAINDNAPSNKTYMEEEAKKGNIFATRKIYADFYLDDKAYNLDYFLTIDVEKTCKSFEER